MWHHALARSMPLLPLPRVVMDCICIHILKISNPVCECGPDCQNLTETFVVRVQLAVHVTYTLLQNVLQSLSAEVESIYSRSICRQWIRRSRSVFIRVMILFQRLPTEAAKAKYQAVLLFHTRSSAIAQQQAVSYACNFWIRNDAIEHMKISTPIHMLGISRLHITVCPCQVRSTLSMQISRSYT